MREVVQIHHIDKIDSKKGNIESNLIVICPECHRRAHLPQSYFERKISKTQLKIYKKRWILFCEKFPYFDFKKSLLVYSFLNRPRIESLFKQLSTNHDNDAIKFLQDHMDKQLLHYGSLERIFETVLNNTQFVNLELLKNENNFNNLIFLEGLPIYIGSGFYSRGLKSPIYYNKEGINEFPYLYNKTKIGNSSLMIKITFDPRFIISTTGYVELSGHHKLSCYGYVKRIHKKIKNTVMDIMPLAIGIIQPIHSANAYIRHL